MENTCISSSNGLLGSPLSEKFAIKGWNFYGIDNFPISYFLISKDAETRN